MTRVATVMSALALFTRLAARAQPDGTLSPASIIRRNLGMSTSDTYCDAITNACMADSSCQACWEVFLDSLDACGGLHYDIPPDDVSYYFSYDYSYGAICEEMQDTSCCAIEAVEKVTDCATNNLWAAMFGCEHPDCGHSASECAGSTTSGNTCYADSNFCTADSDCNACFEAFYDSVGPCGGALFNVTTASPSEVEQTFCCAVQGAHDVPGCMTNDLWLPLNDCVHPTFGLSVKDC